MPWIRTKSADVIDVFVYVVVINLAVQFVPEVISETFTASLLTAVLLKATLEAVLAAKARVLSRLKAAQQRSAKVLWAIGLWLLAAGSKVFVLELVAFVFGDSVKLGGLVAVTGLVVTLLAARAGVRWLLFAEVDDR